VPDAWVQNIRINSKRRRTSSISNGRERKQAHDFIAIFVPWYWQEEYYKNPDDGFTKTNEEYELAELYGLATSTCLDEDRNV
jgi:hypothetical protein